MHTTEYEIKEVKIILKELKNNLEFFEDRLTRLKEGEAVATYYSYRSSHDLAYLCPECDEVSGDIGEWEEYQDNKVPLEKDAICDKCQGGAE